MKYVKILGAVAAATVALMAFVGAGTASATVLCSSNTSPCAAPYGSGTRVSMSLEAGTEFRWRLGFMEFVCEQATMAGELTSPGGVGQGVTETLNNFSFGGCSGKVKTLKPGVLRFDATSGTDGIVNGTGAEIEVEQMGISCVYGWNTAKVLGPYTSTTGSSGPPTLVEEIEVTKIAGSFLCANPAHWEARFVQTTPANAWLESE